MKLLSKLSIRTKITVVFITILFLIGVPLIININSLINLYNKSYNNLSNYKAKNYLLEISGLIKEIEILAYNLKEASSKTEIININEAYSEKYKRALLNIDNLYKFDENKNESRIKDKCKSILDELSLINLYFGVIKDTKLELFENKKINTSEYSKKINSIETNLDGVSTVVEKIDKIISSLLKNINYKTKENDKYINSLITNSKNKSLLSLTLLTILSLLLLMLLTNYISSNLLDISNILRKLSIGHIDNYKTNDNNDEFGYISQTIHNIIISLKETTGFAEQLAKGNFDIEISPLSDYDELRTFLLQLKSYLKRAQEEQKIRELEDYQRRKISEGLTKFSEILRTQQKSLKELAETLIIELVRELDSLQGVFFVLKEETNRDEKKIEYLQLLAAYAWNRKKYLEKRIEIGEGLIGSVALEKFTIHITDVPEDYIEIKSGTGETDPKAILIVPLLFEDNILGVIELARLDPYKNFEINLVEKIGESIAATLQNIKINEKTEILLKETRHKSEEMKEQEELLKRNIEEFKLLINEKNKEVHQLREKIKLLEKQLTKKINEKSITTEKLEKIRNELDIINSINSVYKNILNNVQKPILILDENMKIAFVNQAFLNNINSIKIGDNINYVFKASFEEVEADLDKNIKKLDNLTVKTLKDKNSYKIKLLSLPIDKNNLIFAVIFEKIESKKEIISSKLKKNIMECIIKQFKIKKALKNKGIEINIDDVTEFIEWNKEFETGLKSIDNQHKKWLSIINKVINAIKNNEEKQKLSEIFNELIDFTRYHFAFEEKYMEEFGYTLTDEHKIKHNFFINSILSSFNKYIKGDISVTLELLEILTDWVIKHVTITDQKYVDLFKKKGLK